MKFPHQYQHRVVMYNRATVELGFDLNDFAAALREVLNKCFSPYWGTNATIRVGDGSSANCLGLVFLDDADVHGALSYHDLTTGEPLAKVFVNTVRQNGEELSVAASHELFEMLVDPGCNRYAMREDNALFPLEVCDAVEEGGYIDVLNFRMSNFCLPSWFDSRTMCNVFDFLDLTRKPFQLEAGGYALTLSEGKVKHLFGSADKKARFKLEDRRGHRNDQRLKALEMGTKMPPRDY